MNYYIVGKILNTHGLKGELRVKDDSILIDFMKAQFYIFFIRMNILK